MICRQRRIVQPPPLQVVKVPGRHRQMYRELHPVSLRFKIAVHRRNTLSYILTSELRSQTAYSCSTAKSYLNTPTD